MSYDETLAGRARRLLVGTRGMDEKLMFGGVAFLLHGKMCCGIIKTNLVVRVGPEGYGEVLKERHVRPMDFTGMPIKGFVYVAPAGCRDDASLKRWLDRGVRFAASLPAKTPGKGKRGRRTG